MAALPLLLASCRWQVGNPEPTPFPTPTPAAEASLEQAVVEANAELMAAAGLDAVEESVRMAKGRSLHQFHQFPKDFELQQIHRPVGPAGFGADGVFL